MSENSLIPAERIERRILLVRGHKVMLDYHLAELYEVETRVLNQAVKRNLDRFPADFMFQLSVEETDLILPSQNATASAENSSQIVTGSGVTTSKSKEPAALNSSQSVMSSRKHRGLAYRPYAFTEQGVAMLSSVLHSPRAVQVNITIMRTFVQLRQILASHGDLARKLEALEKKYDKQFKIVFDAIRELMADPKPAKRGEIGFHTILPGKGVTKKVSSRKQLP